MKRLVMTGWSGTEHGMMSAMTAPLMERYATLHGCEFACVNLHSDVAPPSWMKVPYLFDALHSYDEVCWVDSDIVIVRSDESVFSAVPDGPWQAVVEHKTECGAVPNCGMWLVRKQAVGLLELLWTDGLPKYRDHHWWEQAAMLEKLGYSIHLTDGAKGCEIVSSSQFRDRTHFLPAEWNDHPRDERRSQSPRFIHVTQYGDRVESVRRLCATSDLAMEAFRT